MKKLMCVFIAALFLLSACTPGGDESITDISGTVSENEGPQGIDYTLTKESVDKMLADRTSAIKGEADRGGERVNLAKNKEYTVSSGDNEKFPNKGKPLTDGEFKETHYKFVKTGWMAVTGAGAQVVVDLGEVKENISDFEASTCKNTEYNVDVCEAVFVSISDDGENFVPVVTDYTMYYGENSGFGDRTPCQVSFNKNIKAKAVRSLYQEA